MKTGNRIGLAIALVALIVGSVLGQTNVVDNGDAGYTEVGSGFGGVGDTSDYGGSSRWNNTDGDYFQYEFTGLAKGLYAVYATWLESFNASYVDYWAGGVVMANDIHQTQAPQADLILADGRGTSIEFQLVGVISSTGLLTVKVENVPGGGGAYAKADAIAVVRIGDAVELTKTAYIDFGSVETNGTHADGVARTWNVLTTTSATGLLDEDGTATAVNLSASMGGTVLNSVYGYDQGDTQAPGLDWASDASGDCWQLDTSSPDTPYSITFTGLTPNGDYQIVIFGGRFVNSTVGIRTMGIRIQNSAWTVKDTNKASTWIYNVQADAAGEILMEMYAPSGNGHLDAMSITKPVNLDGTAYIDFGAVEQDHTTADTRSWNAITGSASNLVDEAGDPTTVNLTITEDHFESMNEPYGFEQGDSQPITGKVVDDWASDALGDCWYPGIANPDEFNKLELSGLEPNATYDMVIFGGRWLNANPNAVEDRRLAIEINDWAMLPGGWTTKNTSVASVWEYRATATSAGKIQIAMYEEGDALNFAHLNAMSLKLFVPKGTIIMFR